MIEGGKCFGGWRFSGRVTVLDELVLLWFDGLCLLLQHEMLSSLFDVRRYFYG